MLNYEQPDASGHFGPYGGSFVAETLVHALDELKACYAEARRDPAFRAEFESELMHFVGRPSPIYHAARMSRELGGAQIYLKREDLNHTGAHKINNTIGQAMLARRMGKPRVIAETGAGQHGVATATICARYGLECVVYMGAEDVKRQAPNVYRMKLLGAKVVPVTSGSQTLKDSLNEALRDWVTNVENTFYIIGTVAGPHPYPMMVRDFQRVIGDECITQMPAMAGRQPDAVIACVGGGSNAMGIFYPYIGHSGVRLVGVEAAGHGIETGRHSASITGGSAGVLHGNRTYLLQDANGQISETHSISAGLDYPGVGPEHAYLHDIGRAEYVSVTDDEALAAFHRLCRTEGIIPALESSHAVAWAMKMAPTMRSDQHLLVNLSGRGDKDIGTVAGLAAGRSRRNRGARAIGIGIGRVDAGGALVSRIGTALGPLLASGRKALVPFVTAGDPHVGSTVAIMQAMASAGADVIELGVPFSDPMADGPVIQKAGERALARGVGLGQVLAMVRSFRELDSRTPVVLMGYANPIERYGIDRFVADADRAGVDGVLVVDYPPEECQSFSAMLKAHDIDPIFLLAPTSSDARIREVARIARGYVYHVSMKGVTGAGLIDMASVAGMMPRIKAHVRLPVFVGFGIRDAQTAQAVAAVSDGVVIGSALVQLLEDASAEEAPVRAAKFVAEIRNALDFLKGPER